MKDYVQIYDVQYSASEPVCMVQVGPRIKDSARIVGFTNTWLLPNKDGTQQREWKCFVLLTNGELHEFVVATTHQGSVSCSKYDLSPDSRIDLKTLVDAPTSDSCTFALSSLVQSSMLVYEQNGHVYGLLHNKGIISRSVTLLESGSEHQSKVIKGPFTHWQDLGLVGDVWFRATCTGYSDSSPVRIFLDFKEGARRTRVVPIEQDSHLDEIRVEGGATFSGPICVHGDTTDDKQLAEAAYVCSLTSAGSVHVLRDSSYCHTVAFPAKSRPQKRAIPLLAFESLTSITEHVDFFTDTNGERNGTIKGLLHRDNDSYLSSFTSSGFCLHMVLQESTVSSSNNSSPLRSIAAVRVLLGSTALDSIPREVSILGQSVVPEKNARKWYTFRLNPIEVLVGIRCGLVSLRVSECQDSTCKPVVDALEVYGSKREENSFAVPVYLKSVVAMEQDSEAPTPQTQLRLSSIIHTLKCVQSVNQLPCDEKHVEILRSLMKTAIQRGDTTNLACTRDLVASCLTCAADVSHLLDEATVAGCAHLLEFVKDEVSTGTSTGMEHISQLWTQFVPQIAASFFSVSRVARSKPKRYFDIISTPAVGSIAEKVGWLVDVTNKTERLGDIIGDVMEICLLEAAITKRFGEPDAGRRIIGFEVIQHVFSQAHSDTVRQACLAIKRFCQKHSSVEGVPKDETDLFASQSMVVCYRCDGCGLFPISDNRFSIGEPENAVDLCGKCHHRAETYAASHNPDDKLIINRKPLGDTWQLVCSDVCKMKSFPLPKRSAGSSSLVDTGSTGQVFQRQQLFGEYLDGLLAALVNLSVQEGHGPGNMEYGLIFSLINDLSRLLSSKIERSGRTIERSGRIARKLCDNLSGLLLAFFANTDTRNTTQKKVENILTALSSLVVPDTPARDAILEIGTYKSIKLEDKRFKCGHGLPAACRAVPSSGEKFWTCGLQSKAHRCNFFAWHDQPGEEVISVHNEPAASAIWKALSRHQPEKARSCLELLLEFMGSVVSELDADAAPRIQVLQVSNTQICEPIVSKKEHRDGVLCSINRLRLPSEASCFVASESQDVGTSQCVTSCLSTLALVSRSSSPGIEKWFTLFLQLEDRGGIFRPLAKRALWQLCGKSTTKFQAVRDDHVHKRHFEKLVKLCSNLFDFCRQLAKQAQCHSHRSMREEFSADQMPLRHFVGAVDLMCEDVHLGSNEQMVDDLLSKLLGTAQKRSDNWRQFCLKPRISSDGTTNLSTFLRLTSILPNFLQVNAMRLASLAFPPLDGTTSTNANDQPPGDQDFDVEDIWSFARRFVCNEDDNVVRKLALRVTVGAARLVRVEKPLFDRLEAGPMIQTGSMGKMYNEFLLCFEHLVRGSNTGAVDSRVSARVEQFCRKQLMVASSSRSSDDNFFLETKGDGSPGHRARIDLTRCGHVISRLVAVSAPGNKKSRKVSDQVSPLTRTRLDTRRDSCVSNEFNLFVALSYRAVITEINVQISDPRGRYTKTINFYTSPRPAERSADLKDAERYGEKWRLCGTMNLEKGAEKGSCVFILPTVAANLRVEFAEFYERPGSAKDDSFVVHCPRCTRVVTNEHGVCGGCGEVAFQCRKCRHINYDRLDSFLCVECGYCSAGSFAFDVLAGVASNAVAITCDQDLKHSYQMFRTASKIQEDLRTLLQQKLGKLRAVVDGGNEKLLVQRPPELNSTESTEAEEAPDENYLKKFNRRGSVVKMIARRRPEDEDRDDPVSRLLATVSRHRAQQRGSDRNSSRSRSEDASSNQKKQENVEEIDRMFRLLHEAERECFALERRIEAWNRLEAGNLESRIVVSADTHHVDDEPCYCCHCAVGVAYHLVSLWKAMLINNPDSVVVKKDFVNLLLSHDLSHNRLLTDAKRAAVRDIALYSPTGRTIVLEVLRLRLMALQDVHSAEVLSLILKSDPDDATITEPFLTLAQEAMSW